MAIANSSDFDNSSRLSFVIAENVDENGIIPYQFEPQRESVSCLSSDSEPGDYDEFDESKLIDHTWLLQNLVN
jgi:hypothetical protein